MPTGIGIHIDAPSHRFLGRLPVSEISLENLTALACVIQVADKATSDYEIFL